MASDLPDKMASGPDQINGFFAFPAVVTDDGPDKMASTDQIKWYRRPDKMVSLLFARGGVGPDAILSGRDRPDKMVFFLFGRGDAPTR